MSATTAPRVGDRVTINCPASVTHGQTGTVTHDDTALRGGGVTVRLDGSKEHRTYAVTSIIVHPNPVVAVPERLVKELGEYMVRIGGDTDTTTDLPRAMLESLAEYLSEDLGCDHEVGVCMCWEGSLVEKIADTLDGKTFCRACSGEGFIWDEAAWERANAFAEARWGMTASDGDGMVPCERCGSTGRVEVQR